MENWTIASIRANSGLSEAHSFFVASKYFYYFIKCHVASYYENSSYFPCLSRGKRHRWSSYCIKYRIQIDDEIRCFELVISSLRSFSVYQRKFVSRVIGDGAGKRETISTRARGQVVPSSRGIVLAQRGFAIEKLSSLLQCGVQLQHGLAVLARTKGSFVPSPLV